MPKKDTDSDDPANSGDRYQSILGFSHFKRGFKFEMPHSFLICGKFRMLS